MGIFNRLFNFAGKKPVAAEGFAAKKTPPKRQINAFVLEHWRTPSGFLDDGSDLVIFDTDDFAQVELPDWENDFDGNSLDLAGDGDSDLSPEVAANSSELGGDESLGLLSDNPDDFEDVPFVDSDDILNDGTDFDELEFEDVPFADGDDLSLDNDSGDGDDGEILPIAIETPSPVFESGVFTVEDSGQVQISLEFDGGKYEGELAIFSLDGMEEFEPGSHDFAREAASRALSDSVLGHVVISDRTEGAKFFGELGESDWNEGEYLGVKTFEMRSGDEFGFMLIPNSTVQKVFDNPAIEGAGRPLFSMATANPNDAFHLGQIADVTGDGTTFVMEDLRVDTGSDRDYNDLIFRVTGASGKAVTMDRLIADGIIDPDRDWRTTELGQQITFNVESYAAPGKELPGDPIHPALPEPTVPQTTVDQGGNGFSELTLPHDEIVEPNQGGALPNTPTSIKASLTQDIIDQVSRIDPTDVYQVSSHQLTDTQISVLSGNTSVSILTPEGEVLSQQVLTRGTHSLNLPDNVSGKVLLKFDSQNSSNATYILRGFESKAPEPFNIDVQFESGVTASQQAVIQAAARSVESVIGQGLPSAIVDGKIIDDVNFKIAVTNLDGAGGTLAQTKIDFMRYGTLLPAQSITQFDVNDIAQLEQSGQLFSVVQHEILHGLGFGNLWEAKGLVDYAGTPLAQYNGEQAVKEFQTLGGPTDYIPLETEGDGSSGLHWHEELFQDELMTHDLGFQTGTDEQLISPLSAVTIAALADLGYRVNLDRAKPNWGLFGEQFNPDNLTEAWLEEFWKRQAEFDPRLRSDAPINLPPIDPTTIPPEFWAHAERGPNGEYYDWVPYVVSIPGDGFWKIAERTMGNGIDWPWIANHNGYYNEPYWLYLGDRIEIPVHHPNYEWEQEQERLRREAELQRQQEEEERRRREEEERLNNDQAEQERKRREEEERQRQAEAQQRELEEQAQRLREEQERRRQQEEYEREQARLRELERQREIARQKGKGGQDWFFATRLPEFSSSDPFVTSLTGETVGNLVPDDYYRFNLSRNGRVTAELRKLLADADLVLYDVRDRPIAWSMREGITDEQIIADLIPGTYMLRVNSPKGVTTDYELIVKFQHLLSATQTQPLPPGWRPTTIGGNPKTSLHSNPTEANPLHGFLNPLNGSGTVTQGNGGSTSHTGRAQYAIDYGVPIGTPVYAMRSGTVVGVVDKYPDTGGGYENRNNFNYVLIEHDGGYRSAYLHLQQGSNSRIGLKVGDTVNAGELIGYSGNSGWSTGPHLHVEVHKPTAGGYFGQTVPFVIGGDAAGDDDSSSDDSSSNIDYSDSDEYEPSDFDSSSEYVEEFPEEDISPSVKHLSLQEKLDRVINRVKEYTVEYVKEIGEEAINDVVSSFNAILDDLKKIPNVDWLNLGQKVFDFVVSKLLGRTPIGRAILIAGGDKTPTEILWGIWEFIKTTVTDPVKAWEAANKLFEDAKKSIGDIWNAINKLIEDSKNLEAKVEAVQTEANLDKVAEVFVEFTVSQVLDIAANLLTGKVKIVNPKWKKNLQKPPVLPRIKIDLKHIFHGAVKNNKAKGFHSRHSIGEGLDFGSKVTEVTESSLVYRGVYKAKIEVKDKKTGNIYGKTSTFFPDDWDKLKVVNETRSAYQDAISKGQVKPVNNGDKWVGISSSGYKIEGYFQNGQISTAYPLIY